MNFVESFRNKIDKEPKLKIILRGLLAMTFLIGLYLVLYPFFPRLEYVFKKDNKVYPYETRLEGILSSDGNNEFENNNAPEENRLVIPAIDVDMPIIEGVNDSVLDLGVWHRPATGFPGSGNMVLTGHRVGYAFLPEDVKNSTSFYNLDKLQIGDYVIVYWNQIEYDYQINDYGVVDKEEVSIESQDGEERLTLYTCHPIGQNTKRLVYYAEPIELELDSEN